MNAYFYFNDNVGYSEGTRIEQAGSGQTTLRFTLGYGGYSGNSTNYKLRFTLMPQLV